MIECVLLGSGGMMPMPYRFLVSLAVRLEGRTLLFDCGEGTQIPIKMTKIGIKPIRDIFISHLHADHVTGLPGMLMMLNQSEPDGPVRVHGPRGIADYVDAQERTLAFERDYPLEVNELHGAEGVALAEDGFEVVFRQLRHRTRCLGYAVIERDQPGRFSVERARGLGVPEGPAWGRLQRGETVTLETGGEIRPDQVLGPPRAGRKIVYASDTRPCRNLVELARGADLFFVEGMFEDELADDANQKGHQTVVQAARQAREAGVARAVLFHFSPRYRDEDLARLGAQARAEFPAIEIGRDLARFEIPVRP